MDFDVFGEQFIETSMGHMGLEGSLVIRMGHMMASILPSGSVTNKGCGATRSGMIRASRQIVWPISKTTGTTGVAPHITAFRFCSVSSNDLLYIYPQTRCSNELGRIGGAFQAVCLL